LMFPGPDSPLKDVEWVKAFDKAPAAALAGCMRKAGLPGYLFEPISIPIEESVSILRRTSPGQAVMPRSWICRRECPDHFVGLLWPSRLRWALRRLPRHELPRYRGQGRKRVKCVRPAAIASSLHFRPKPKTRRIAFQVDGLFAGNTTSGHLSCARNVQPVRRFDGFSTS